MTPIRPLSPLVHLALIILAFVATLAPGEARAQAWTLDPAVAPTFINDSPALATASFIGLPSGQVLAYGSFTHVNETPAARIARIGADGQLDRSFAPDSADDESVYAIAPLRDGRFVAILGPAFSIAVPAAAPVAQSPTTAIDPGSDMSVRVHPGPLHQIVRLRADGRKDTTFTPLEIERGAQLTALPDGRILVWGTFSSVGRTPRNGLARLAVDGTLDAAFAPSLTNTTLSVSAVAPLASGSIIVSAGAYSQRTPTYFLSRVLANGTVDASFAPPAPTSTYGLLAAQPDGSVLAGRGTTLVRYSANGAQDTSYPLQIPALRYINRMLPLSDGRVAVEAYVAPDGGLGAPAVFILNASGRVERDLRSVPGAQRGQRLLAVAPDGRLWLLQGPLVAPTLYQSVTATPPRVMPDYRVGPAPVVLPAAPPSATTPIETSIIAGPLLVTPELTVSSTDATSLTALPTTMSFRSAGTVWRVDADASGHVFASGAFTQVDGQPRAGLARFLPNGTLDPTFVPAAGNLLFVPPDGRVIVHRTTIGPEGSDGLRRYVTQIVRLQANGSIDPSFTFPSTLGAGNTRWFAAASDGRLLVSAFEPDSTREQNLKLIWLGSNGQRSATLATTFTGFARYFAVPLQGGTANPAEPTSASYPVGYGLPNVIDAVQVLGDGRLLVAGAFTAVNGSTRHGLVRLRSDGSLDTPPGPGTNAEAPVLVTTTSDPTMPPLPTRPWTPSPSIPGSLTALPLPDGSALLFGGSRRGNEWQRIVRRVRPDGSIDASFQPPNQTLYPQARVLSDGSFFSNGRRFNADGWPDPNLIPEPRLRQGSGSLSSAAMGADGALWVAGTFDQLNGQRRSGLARFTAREVVGITAQPQSATVIAGREAIFQVGLGTRRPATFRWTRDGTAIAGATTANLRIPNAWPEHAGVYRVSVTIDGQTFTSAPATLTVAPSTARLVNFSARSEVDAGSPQVAGVVLSTDAPRPVLLRAIARGLPVSFGAPALTVPVLTLFDDGRALAEDRGGATTPMIATQARRVGAFPVNELAPPTPQTLGIVYGSALAPTLGAGAFTVVTSSGDGSSGMSLFEFYDSGTESMPALVRNLSIRGRTAPGAQVLTAGFVVAGDGPLRVLIRGIGPSLATFGLEGGVANPQLAVFGAGDTVPLAINASWSGAPEIAAAAQRSGAFPLPTNSRDAALLLTLEPGAYTAQLSSTNDASGTGLIEIYVVDEE